MADPKKQSLRERLHEIIFEADTKEGRNFDIALLWMIGLSVVLVILESVPSINQEYGEIFNVLEWIITIFFSIEYILRVWTAKKPLNYIFSFYGIIDLVSTIPMYLSLYDNDYHFLIIMRALRLLRIFKILNMKEFSQASRSLARTLKENKDRIIVFITVVVFISLIQGTLMYVIEGPENGFTSIPRAMYWSIVTLTTVGYGDITPSTALGKFIASATMILGYGILAIGMVNTATNYIYPHETRTNTQTCTHCLREDHRDGAKYCYNCGEKI